MNFKFVGKVKRHENNTPSFRPQQGLTIMNYKGNLQEEVADGFRPQQGLTIMNNEQKEFKERQERFKFPSPTGVNYYEY